MVDDSGQWSVEIDKERFEKLRGEERFCQLVALARAVNALRFVQAALLAYSDGDASLAALRTRYNSFFFTCSLIYEALLLVQRLAKHYRSVPEFAGLHEILKDPVATELRESNLAIIRNRLTFHFGEDEIAAQLATNDKPARFVSGKKENVDTYYELADLCALGAFSGSRLDEDGTHEKLQKQFQEATNLAIRFMNAAERFIVAVVMADGWKRK